MKTILFVTHLYPYPPDDGGRIVTYNTIRELVRYGHKVILCSFAEENQTIEPLPFEIETHTIPISYANSYKKAIMNLSKSLPYNMEKYIHDRMADLILQIVKRRKIDILYIDHLHMAYYARMVKQKGYDLFTILRQHNVESTIFQRAIEEEDNVIKKAYLGIQYKRLYRYESQIVSLFDVVYTITDEDSERMKDMNRHVVAKTLPAGVDTEKYFPMESNKKDEGPVLMFLGTMSWLPNVNGITWFIESIFPKVLQKYQKTKLYIVGKNPPEKLYKFHSQYPDNIVITGYVEDERTYIANSDVFIVPLKIGGGMRIKILNALAMKKPIVTTSVGVEGIKLHPFSLLVADEEEEFANGIIKLLAEKEFADQMSETGFRSVKESYSNSAIFKRHAEEINQYNTRRATELVSL
ncbi:glycosyltransferase family 4 protein [Bacillus smithii]|uniref:glycosyltransferase family 4 protein n=1 Tax=Bacillus smithii TaxID=1479 RepID=UPI003D1CEC4E